MENNCENNDVKSDLFIRVKATKSPKFNAPTELSDRTTLISVEVNEEQTEKTEILDLNIHIQSRGGSKLTKADAGKTA